MPWTIKREKGPGAPKRFEASRAAQAPHSAWSDYVRLTDKHQVSEVLKGLTRDGATGELIFVSSSSRLTDGDEVTVVTASEAEYRWFHLFHDRDARLLFGGLMLALIGVVVDAMLALFKLKAMASVVPDALVGPLTLLSFGLKALGLIVAAIGGWKKLL